MSAGLGVENGAQEKGRLGLKLSASIRGALSGASPSLGPLQHDPRRLRAQPPVCNPRSRECLLEGCGRCFLPLCGRSEYCSQGCRETARRWSLWKAQQRYRASERGKARRREQSRRYRQRAREARDSCSANDGATGSDESREGHHKGPKDPAGEKDSCDRPGCYELFGTSSRSPLKRFCSVLCRQALRRARRRQERWRRNCAGCCWARLADDVPRCRGP